MSFNACVSSCWQSLCRVVKVDSGVLNDVVKNPLTKTSISLYHVKSASPVILTPACGNECGSLEGNSPSSSRKSSALIETVAFFFFLSTKKKIASSDSRDWKRPWKLWGCGAARRAALLREPRPGGRGGCAARHPLPAPRSPLLLYSPFRSEKPFPQTFGVLLFMPLNCI